MNDYDPKLDMLRQMLALSIINRLEDSGFQEEPLKCRLKSPLRAEKVYSRVVGSPKNGMKVIVYTTVFGGAAEQPLDVRKGGKDAIRVCGVYITKDGATRGLVGERRVHRVGNIEEIVDRMVDRMRTAWKALQVGERCNKCGAPKFLSKGGNKVCAEICWKTDKEKLKSKENFKYKKRRKRYY